MLSRVGPRTGHCPRRWTDQRHRRNFDQRHFGCLRPFRAIAPLAWKVRKLMIRPGSSLQCWCCERKLIQVAACGRTGQSLIAPQSAPDCLGRSHARCAPLHLSCTGDSPAATQQRQAYRHAYLTKFEKRLGLYLEELNSVQGPRSSIVPAQSPAFCAR